MNNFISIVNQFNLVIYTDERSSLYIPDITKSNPRIRIIIKPFEQFYNYQYKDFWIENHKKNTQLNEDTCWELNMLWSEKIWFVKETIERKYYNTDFYGWCDIGYFRNRKKDTHTKFLSNWPNINKMNALDKRKIVYACVNNNVTYMEHLFNIVQDKNENDLPKQEIPNTQTSIAGGFFILYKDKINWWSEIYKDKLRNYFKHNYLVKDDQIILLDCILSNQESFLLFRENNYKLDNWFMFQRILI
jgi:hypothetical protein